ncbi:MAG: ABC transporter permease [Dehalococcoidales bacterium]|nr:MAG: ABC transporter permease [Dehalococcoidales bacterium]
MRWHREIVPPIALIAVLIIGWYFIAEVSGLSSFILPTPWEVIKAGWDTRSILVNAIGNTLLATGIGLVLALITGTGIAALMDFWPLMNRALYPILVVSQTIQILAIAPIFIIWFGFGLTPTILTVILFCFFPLAISTADGLTSSDPELIALLRTMKASRWQIWRMVRLPSALPSFFSGLRLAVTYSVVAATIGEWVGGSSGLGLYMLRSKNALATDQVFAAMFITSLLSIFLFMLVYYVERLVLPWYHSRQRKEKWEGSGIF